MAGFGRHPFGKGPFGRSDTGRDLIIESFPVEYFDDSLVLDAGETPKDNNKDPLLKLLKTYAYQVFQRRLDIEKLPMLLDFETAPLEIVRLWGDMLGLGIDKNDPEFLQRSFLGNASQWLQIKSSDQGYQVRGLASGFDVSVDDFWRLDLIYEPLVPPRFRYYLIPKDADATAQKIFHTDMPPGTFPGTPTDEDATYAKSSYVRIVFSVHEPRKNNVDYNKLLDLVIDKIRDVVGIHHELQAPQFLVKIPVPTNFSVNFALIEEFSSFQASENYIYDITPADEIPTDNVMSVIMTTGDGMVFDITPTITVVFETDEFQYDLILDVSSELSASFVNQEESDLAIDQTGTTVDLEQLVVLDIDVNPSISFSIESDENSTNYSIDASEGTDYVVQEVIVGAMVEAMDHFDITVADVINLDRQNVTIQLIQSSLLDTVILPIDALPSADFSASGTGEKTVLVVDPAVAAVREIDETGNHQADVGVTATLQLGNTFSIIDGNIEVNESVSFELGEQPTLLAVEVESTAIVSISEGTGIDHAVNASVSLVDEIDGANLSVTVGASASLELNEGLSEIIVEASSISVTDGELSAINHIVNVVVTVVFDSSSATLSIPVNESVSIEAQESVSAVSTEAISSSLSSIEQTGIEATVPVSAFITNESDSVSLVIGVGELAEFVLEEQSSSSASEFISTEILTVGEVDEILLSVTVPVTVSIVISSATIEIPVGESVSFNLSESFQTSMSELVTVTEQAETESQIINLNINHPITVEIDLAASVSVSAAISVSLLGSEMLSESMSEVITVTQSDAEVEAINLSVSVPVSVEMFDAVAIVVAAAPGVTLDLIEQFSVQVSEVITITESDFEVESISIGINAPVSVSIVIADSMGVYATVSAALDSIESSSAEIVESVSINESILESDIISVAVNAGVTIDLPIVINAAISASMQSLEQSALESLILLSVTESEAETEIIEMNVTVPLSASMIEAVSIDTAAPVSVEIIPSESLDAVASEFITVTQSDSEIESINLNVSVPVSVELFDAVSVSVASSLTIVLELSEFSDASVSNSITVTETDYEIESISIEVSVPVTAEIQTGNSIDVSSSLSVSIESSESLAASLVESISVTESDTESGEIIINVTVPLSATIDESAAMEVDASATASIDSIEAVSASVSELISVEASANERTGVESVLASSISVLSGTEESFSISVGETSILISSEGLSTDTSLSLSVSEAEEEIESIDINLFVPITVEMMSSEHLPVEASITTDISVLEYSTIDSSTVITVTESDSEIETISLDVTVLVTASISIEAAWNIAVSESTSFNSEESAQAQLGITATIDYGSQESELVIINQVPTVDLSAFGEMSAQVSASADAVFDSTEALSASADETLTTAVLIHSGSTIEAVEAVSIEESAAELVATEIAVPLSSDALADENSDWSSSLSLSISMQRVDSMLDADLSVSASISSSIETGESVDVSVTEVVLESSDEDLSASAILSSSATIEKVDSTLDVSPSISASIEIDTADSSSVDVIETSSANIEVFEALLEELALSVGITYVPSEESRYGISVGQTATIALAEESSDVIASVGCGVSIDASENCVVDQPSVVAVDPSLSESSAIEVVETITVDGTATEFIAVIHVEISLPITVGETVDYLSSEELSAAQAEVVTVDVLSSSERTGIDASATASIGISSSENEGIQVVSAIAVSPEVTEGSSADTTVPGSVSISDSEFDSIVLNINETITVSLEQVSAEMFVSVGETATEKSQEQTGFDASVSSSVSISDSEFDSIVININETVTVSMEVVTATFNIAVSETVTESIKSQTSLSTALSLSASFTREAESETITIPVSETAAFQNQEKLSATVTESLNISSSVSTLATLGVVVSGTVTFSSEAEGTKYWQIAAGENTTYRLQESSIGSNALKGWWVDPLANYDMTPADVTPTETSGYVTMTITITP